MSTQADPRREAPPAVRHRVGAKAVLLAICVAAAALRFSTLDVQSFDFDEAFTVSVDLSGSLGHVLHVIPVKESAPQLYFITAWLWTHVFGRSEIGVRSLSALLGTALVPVAFLIGRRLGSIRAGLIAALLVALNPLQVWYSQEARTYEMLALLSGLSFWTFVRALDRPTRGRLAVWALVAALAILSHYFAAFLVAAEVVWLLCANRDRETFLASTVLALAGAALTPLLLRQKGGRTQWISNSPLWDRFKEVLQASAVGPINPTLHWKLALVLALIVVPVGLAVILAAPKLTVDERHGAFLAVGVGGAALLIPLVLDIAGLHYVDARNVLPALTVLLIALGLILGAQGAARAGVAGAVVASVFFLAVTLDDTINPALARPDYRAAAKALGSPNRGQVVVTPDLGNLPLALYRPHATEIPASGYLAREVVVILPIPQADASSRRAATPAAPPGFTFAGRDDARTYSAICYSSPVPRLVTPSVLLALVGNETGSSAQAWPGSAPPTLASEITRSPCAA